MSLLVQLERIACRLHDGFCSVSCVADRFESVILYERQQLYRVKVLLSGIRTCIRQWIIQ